MAKAVVRFQDCVVDRQTAEKLLIFIPELDCPPVWIPRSVIPYDSEVHKYGTSGELMVFEWFAVKQGWV